MDKVHNLFKIKMYAWQTLCLFELIPLVLVLVRAISEISRLSKNLSLSKIFILSQSNS